MDLGFFFPSCSATAQLRPTCHSQWGLGPRPSPSPSSFLVKEEEKQKLLQRGSELQSEHQQLEERDRRLASAVKVCGAGGVCPGPRDVADQSVTVWSLTPQKGTDSAASFRDSAGGEGSSVAK